MDCWVRPDLSSAPSVNEFWLRKNSELRLKLYEKVYLESHRGRGMNCRRNEVRKQVTEAKERALELRREKGKAPGGRKGGGEGSGLLPPGRAPLGPLSGGLLFGGLRGGSQ